MLCHPVLPSAHGGPHEDDRCRHRSCGRALGNHQCTIAIERRATDSALIAKYDAQQTAGMFTNDRIVWTGAMKRPAVGSEPHGASARRVATLESRAGVRARQHDARSDRDRQVGRSSL